MLRFGETKVAKVKFYSAKKEQERINFWDVNVDDVVVSKLFETRALIELNKI